MHAETADATGASEPVQSEWQTAIGGVGEVYFTAFAPELYQRGWTCYPQEATGKRRPWRIDGATLAWKPYQTQPVPPEVFRKWVAQAPGANVAVIMGPTSGNALAFDIDVTDEDLSLLTEELLVEICGPTRYKRIGNPPKIALFYRLAEECSFTTKAIRYAEDEEGSVASPHAVEILAKHATITFYGTHHSTGRMFGWRDQPASCSPLDLPLITEAQIFEFIERMAELKPIYKGRGGGGYSVDISDLPTSIGTKRLVVPTGHSDWSLDPNTGLIVDGREKYLTRLVFGIVRANPSSDYTREDLDQLSRMAFDVFIKNADRSGRWNDNYIWKEIYSRVQRNCAQLAAGEIRPDFRSITARAGDKIVVEPSPALAPASKIERHGEEVGALGWLTAKPFVVGGKRKGLPISLNEAAPAAVEALRTANALRDEIAQRASWDRIKSQIEAVADDLIAAVRNQADGSKAVLVRAPTGAGKTTRIIKRLLEVLRQDPLPRGMFILFLVRSHENADDIARLVERDCAEAAAAGCEAPGGVRRCGDAVIGCSDDARPAVEIQGPVVGIWKGKSADLLEGDTVCQRAEEFKAAIAAQLNASDLCEKEGKEDPRNPSLYQVEKQRRETLRKQAASAGRKPPRFTKNVEAKPQPIVCSFKKAGACHFYNQQVLFADASIIVASHYYSKRTVELPETLRGAAAVVIDEDPSLNMLSSRYVELAMMGNLAVVEATKTEERNGVDTAVLNARSQSAAEVARRALRAGQDPAKVLMGLCTRTAAEVVREAASSGRDAVQSLRERGMSVAADLADLAIADHRDPAQALQDLGSCDDMVKAAKTVATRRKRSELTPAWNRQRVIVEAAARREANERFSVDREAQSYFWRVIEDRIARLRAIEQREDLINRIAEAKGTDEFDALTAELAELPDDARGEHDARLQLVFREPDDRRRAGIRQHVRVSWRSTPNFQDKPLIVLAAGGRKRVLDRVYGRYFDDKQIDAHIQMKIAACVDSQFSNAAFLPHPDDAPRAKANKLRLTRKIRRAITKAAALHGRERILVVATKAVVDYLNSSCWACPPNVEFGHFGGLAGLDFARDYPLIMTIGRSEMPLQESDGLVGALTFDDLNPEAPFDVHGTGTTDGKPIAGDKRNALFRPVVKRTQVMRSGETVTRDVRQLQGGWKEEVELLWREGEIVQAAGRVRPVYKTADNAPTWICIGAALPNEFVVDRFFALDDLVQDATLFDAQRLAFGVITVDGDHWPVMSDAAFDVATHLDQALAGLAKDVREMFLASCSRVSSFGELSYLVAGWADPAEALLQFAIGRESAVPGWDAIERVAVKPLDVRGREHRLTIEERWSREQALMTARRHGIECLTQVDEDEAAEEVLRGDRRADFYPAVGASPEMIAAARDEAALVRLGVDLAHWDQRIEDYIASLSAPAEEPAEGAIEDEVVIVEETLGIAFEGENLGFLEPRHQWMERFEPPAAYASG